MSVVATLSLLGCSAVNDENTTGSSNLPLKTVFDSTGRKLEGAAAEVVRLNEAAEVELNLIARLSTGPDSVLEFYEPAPGELVVSGAGRESDDVQAQLAPEEKPASWAARLWTQYSDGAPMPQEMARLVEQLAKSESGPTENHDAKEPGEFSDESQGGIQWQNTSQRLENGVGTMTQAVVGGYCDTWYYTHNEQPWGIPMGSACNVNFTFEECLDNWTGGRQSTSTGGRVWAHYSNVCAKLGTVLLQVSRWGGGSGLNGGGNWTVPEESGRWYYWQNVTCEAGPFAPECPNVRTIVSEAANDVFHYRYGIYRD